MSLKQQTEAIKSLFREVSEDFPSAARAALTGQPVRLPGGGVVDAIWQRRIAAAIRGVKLVFFSTSGKAVHTALVTAATTASELRSEIAHGLSLVAVHAAKEKPLKLGNRIVEIPLREENRE